MPKTEERAYTRNDCIWKCTRRKRELCLIPLCDITVRSSHRKCPIIPILFLFFLYSLALKKTPQSPSTHFNSMQLSNSPSNPQLLFSNQGTLRLPIHYPMGSKGRSVPRVVCCAIPIARAAGKVLVVTSRKQPNNWLCQSPPSTVFFLQSINFSFQYLKVVGSHQMSS